jgi:hypothetical protein
MRAHVKELFAFVISEDQCVEVFGLGVFRQAATLYHPERCCFIDGARDAASRG